MNYPAIEELIETGQVLIHGSVSPSIKMINGSLIADALPELRLLLANEKKLEARVKELEQENKDLNGRIEYIFANNYIEYK